MKYIFLLYLTHREIWSLGLVSPDFYQVWIFWRNSNCFRNGLKMLYHRYKPPINQTNKWLIKWSSDHWAWNIFVWNFTSSEFDGVTLTSRGNFGRSVKHWVNHLVGIFYHFQLIWTFKSYQITSQCLGCVFYLVIFVHKCQSAFVRVTLATRGNFGHI